MTRLMVTTIVSAFLAGCSSGQAPQQQHPTSGTIPAASATPAAGTRTAHEADMVALALSAAPADVAAHAAVVEMGEGGKMKELRPGTNGWVCMAHPEVMCLDKQWQEWGDAWMAKGEPKVTEIGMGYMLRGDHGASNTDPFATAPTADNQWVVSPPHVMIVTPDRRQLDSLPTDPKVGGPWVMWKGTPYAHIMVPMAPMGSNAGQAK